MRWNRLIKDIEDWFDIKIVPLLGNDRIGLAKVQEEYKELKKAQQLYENLVPDGDLDQNNEPPEQRLARHHRDAEVADLFISLVCFAHANDINLKRVVFATYLKLQKRKWKKTAVPGLVRHVGDD